MSLPQPFLDALADFPADFATAEPSELSTYGTDWTRVYPPRASLLVRPRSTAESARLLGLCHAHHVPVVPSGGRTGLAAGAVAHAGEVVLSTERMRAMDPVDTLGMTVRVQAGAITEAVHAHVAPFGLFWPIDLGAKGSSTVGGNIATNAGGVRVIRYGSTRQWVLGLEVVTAQGEVLELNGALEKNNTGVDLRQLFVGTEGILGFVTAATLKLTRLPREVSVFLFALDSLNAVLRLFEAARAAPFTIMAYEFFTDHCAARLTRHRGLTPPFEASASHYVLLEVEEADAGALDPWLAGLFEQGLVVDGTLAADSGQARALWTLREGISEALSATGTPHKNDIALPLAELSAFCRELEALLVHRYPGWELCLFGHIGDGNLHVNVMKPDELPTSTFLERTHEVDQALFELVKAHRGSVSAEHGVGLLKRPWLGYTRSATEIALMKGLKKLLDPSGILNPGKVLGD